MNDDFTQINPLINDFNNIGSYDSNRLPLNSVGSSFLQAQQSIKQGINEKKVQFHDSSSKINPFSEVRKLQDHYKNIKTKEQKIPLRRSQKDSFQIQRNNSDSLKNAEELFLLRQNQDCSINIFPESFKSKSGSSSSIEKNVQNSDLSQFNSKSSSIQYQLMPLPHEHLILCQKKYDTNFKGLSNDLTNRETPASVQLNSWQKTFIIVIIVISRMLKKAKMIRKIQNVNRMTKEHFIVINDLASSFHVLKRIKKKKLIYRLYFDGCKIIYNSFKFMLIWNIIMLFIYLSSMFLIPMYQIFNQNELKDQQFLGIIYTIIKFKVLFLFFILDNLININSICSTRLNFENIFIQQKQIEQLKFNIKYDLIIFTTLQAYYNSGDIHLVFSIILLIFSLNNIFNQIYQKLNLQCARRFAYCIFVYSIMNHYSALIWMYFIILPSQNSFYDSYIKSIHQIMIGTQIKITEQMSTDYYLGDCLLNIKTLIIISFVLIQIYYYLSNNNSKGIVASFKFFKKLGLPYQTLKNLMTILRYRQENRGIQDNHGLNEIIDKEIEQKIEILIVSNSIFRQQVGDQIVDQILIDLFLNVMQNSQVIKNLCSNQCIKNLCKKIEICQFNENDKNDLYLLMSGYAQKVLTQAKIKLETIEAKAILNEISFLNQQKCDYRYDFSSNCTYGRLSFIDFIETLRQYSQGFELYYMFRENSLYNQQHLRSICYCPICKSHLHSLKSCQATTLLFDRPTLIKENQRLIQNQRQKYARNNTIRFNTLNNKSYIQIQVIGFGLEQQIYREKDITNEVLNILKGNTASNHSGFSVQNSETIDFNSSLGKTPSLDKVGSNRKQSNNSNSASIPRSFQTKNSEKSQSVIQNSQTPIKSSIQDIEINQDEIIFPIEIRQSEISDLALSYEYYFPANNLTCVLRQLKNNKLIPRNSQQILIYQTSIKQIGE